MAKTVVALWLVAASQSPAHAAERTIAVGDLHGDIGNTLRVLAMAGVIDAEGRWAAKDATFVQTGDVVDRGPDARAIYALLQRLEREAAAAGGRVYALLGNHEVMNVHGDWRYVTADDVAAFGGEEARRAAFSRDGDIGRWFATLHAVVMVGDAVFCHGGVSPAWAKHGVERLDQRIRDALFGAPDVIVGSDGPLWFRGFVEEPEERACPALEASLTSLGAKRMVVGHTTRRDGRIQSRCGGRLLVIDTGIASGYGGHLASLVIDGGDARAVYPNGAVDLEDPQ